ncbi:MAG: OmpH family outer membrane protein [Draconibacterium sp.]
MKTILQFVIISVLFPVSSVMGQENLKIGHVNIQEIVKQLPETDTIQMLLKKEADDMEKMFNDMLKEHDSHVKKFEAEQNTYSEFVRKSRENDLMEMATKIQQYQQTANQQLQKRNMELIQPVYDKVNKAIEKVALENGFTYVLDLSNGGVAFHSPTSEDLNSLVLREIGIEKH